MRICIDKPFNIELFYDDDAEFLKSICVYFRKKHDIIEIIEQKVDLEPNMIEKFLDIVSDCGNKTIILDRYDHARYTLRLL